MSRCTVDDSASRLPDRKQDEVRRLLEGPHPTVPADLAVRAAERGRRLLRRRRVLRAVLLVTALVALIALLALAATTWPVTPLEPPADPPPPAHW